MIAIDTNLLVYAHRGDSARHEVARQQLSSLLEGPRSSAIPWPCVHEFLAVATHPRIYDPPTTVSRALEALDAWLSAPGLALLGEGPRHVETLNALLRAADLSGPRVHDARVAAICLDNGVEALWTADRDFSYFPDLKTVNPLVR